MFLLTPEEIACEVEHLMDYNQALKAWDLVKDTDHPLKEKVWAKVKHAFDDQAYRDYYMNDLREYPMKNEIAFDCTKHDERFRWLMPKLMDFFPSSVLDIGCADGYLGLTLGQHGIKSTGLNLYKPSVDLANERAAQNRLPAKFLHIDFRDYEQQHEAVVFFEILEHLPDPEKAIAKAYSLVKSGGRLYISTPVAEKHVGIRNHLAEIDRDSWDADDKPAGHLQLFTEDEFKALLKPYKLVDYYVDETFSQEAEIQK